jgi:hypothetical protein
MKHFFLTILIVLSGITISSAQTGDSSKTKDKPVSEVTQIKAGNTPESKTNPPVTNSSKTIEDIISFLPVAFFLLITSTIFIKLRKDGVKLSDILVDKEAVQEKRKTEASVTIATVNAGQPAAAPVAPAAPNSDGQPTNNPEQSTSRLIAFICGITSIALACCITSYYFYKSFTGTEKVDLGNLSNVLFGLGLGVIPYGFNKIAAALK